MPEFDEIHAKYLEEMRKTVTETITHVVNGKINRLDDKLTAYIKEDTEWKKTADPYIKLAVNISGTWKFIVYVVGGVLVLLGLYNLGK